MAENRWKKKSFIITALFVMIAVATGAAWMVYRKADKPLTLKHRSLREKDVPVYLGEIRVPDDKKPAWVYVYEKKLFVSYFGEERVDIFSPEGVKKGSFRAKITKGRGAPQGMVSTARGLLIADYLNGGIGFYAPNGRLLDAYYETAEKRQIKPVSAAVYGEVLYVTDVNINGWLAVFQDGEMIMEVKGDNEKKKLEFPYGIVVTSDGRVVVTDPAGGKVKVFNCAGWFAYDFPTADIGMKNPQGIAVDGFGRIHIVDNGVGKVFVFDNLGKFMFTYGKELLNPSTLAIDRKNRIIYIANTEKHAISVWGY